MSILRQKMRLLKTKDLAISMITKGLCDLSGFPLCFHRVNSTFQSVQKSLKMGNIYICFVFIEIPTIYIFLLTSYKGKTRIISR